MRPKPSAPPKPVRVAPPTDSNGGDSTKVRIPLQAIVAVLPLEVRTRVVRQADLTDVMVPVPVDTIVSQLGSGVVTMPFGEIRQAAPRIFSSSTNCDHVEVGMPLGEILTRLDPVLLARRASQKKVNVPAEITSPFGKLGLGLTISTGNAKTGTPTTAPVRGASSSSAPAARPQSFTMRQPSAVPDHIFKRAAAPSRSEDASVTPISPIVPASPVAGTPVTPVKPVAPATPTPTPASRPKDFLSAPPVPRAVRPATPVSSAPIPPGTTDESPPLSVSLSSLAESWPQGVRQEIVRFNLANARVTLPARQVEAALKNGRVMFTWKTLRALAEPASPLQPSAYDATELELPLSVLAPLFLARKKSEAKSQQRTAIDETIPNLFFGLPQAEPVAPPPPAAAPQANKVVDTNFYIWDDVSDTARVDETEFKRKMETGGTDFVARYATPNEIVSRAAALDGVAGALIALPDGLMVANRIPPDLNGDTLAAFLPQIFAKVSQTTKELRMGELNNLHFTVGNVPWKIFRVNAIFFAAFGRAAEALPTGPLAALAAELDHKNRHK